MNLEHELKKKKAFWIMITLCTILLLLEGLLSYIISPDIIFGNTVLFIVLGIIWQILYLPNVLIYVLYLYMSYFSLIKYKSPILNTKSFKEYCSMLAYDRPDKFAWTFYRLPKNWKFLFAALGYVFVFLLPIFKFLAVIEWIFTLKTIEFGVVIWFNNYIYVMDIIYVCIYIIVSTVCLTFWFFKEYQYNKTIAVI